MSAAEITGWLIVFGLTALVALVAAGLALMDGEHGWFVILTLTTAGCITAMVMLGGGR